MQMHLDSMVSPLFAGMRVILAVALMCSASQGFAQLSSDDLGVLAKRLADGGDPHEMSLALSGIERLLIAGGENLKEAGVMQAIDLAALVYGTHDIGVPTDRSVGRWPAFDATRLGGKPIFAGADPKSISDPKIRAAYEKALADHESLLTRVSAEMSKLEEGDYCTRVALRVVESSSDKAKLCNAVEKHLAAMQVTPWIRDRITTLVLPKPTAATSQPSTQEQIPTQTTQPMTSAPSVKSTPAPKKTPEAKQTPLTPNEEPASSTPWSIIVVLMVAALGLLWLWLKNRK